MHMISEAILNTQNGEATLTSPRVTHPSYFYPLNIVTGTVDKIVSETTLQSDANVTSLVERMNIQAQQLNDVFLQLAQLENKLRECEAGIGSLEIKIKREANVLDDLEHRNEILDRRLDQHFQELQKMMVDCEHLRINTRSALCRLEGEQANQCNPQPSCASTSQENLVNTAEPAENKKDEDNVIVKVASDNCFVAFFQKFHEFLSRIISFIFCSCTPAVVYRSIVPLQ